MAFLGAGASKAAGLPLTEELLDRIFPRSGASQWSSVRSARQWQRELTRAIKILYPAGDADGFRPSVADFFTILEVVANVHKQRERLPINAAAVLDELRTEISLGLHREVSALDLASTPHKKWLTSDARPDVVITSNWDTLVEHAALEGNLTVRLVWPRNLNDRRLAKLRQGDVVVLKLHGSIDWGMNRSRTLTGVRLGNYYSPLSTAVYETVVFPAARLPYDMTLRFGSLEGARDGEGTAIGFRPPLMATMAVGKNAQIDSLGDVWDDAYWTLSRASMLDIVGYSFPEDDLELRTLFRVSTRRAGRAGLDSKVKVTIRNPSPDAHDRGRSFLGDPIRSDYRVAEAWMDR